MISFTNVRLRPLRATNILSVSKSIRYLTSYTNLCLYLLLCCYLIQLTEKKVEQGSQDDLRNSIQDLKIYSILKIISAFPKGVLCVFKKMSSKYSSYIIKLPEGLCGADFGIEFCPRYEPKYFCNKFRV